MKQSRPRRGVLSAVVCCALLALSALMAAGCSTSPQGGSSSGVQAPDFSGLTLDGEQVSLAGYAGKPLVLVFMASWCGPCREEAPEIDLFYEQNRERVAVLGVAVNDDEADIRALMADNGWTFPVMLDVNRAADAYGVSAIPTTVIIDAEGQIAQRLVGGTTAAKLSSLVDGITR